MGHRDWLVGGVRGVVFRVMSSRQLHMMMVMISGSMIVSCMSPQYGSSKYKSTGPSIIKTGLAEQQSKSISNCKAAISNVTDAADEKNLEALNSALKKC